MDEQLRWMDATEQADLVRSGQVSAAELLAEAQDRIRTLNPALNAVIVELAGAAEAGSPHSDAGDDTPSAALAFLLPAGQLDLHLCVQTEDGITVLDTCPNREVFDRFSSGRDFQKLVAAAGLPRPEVVRLGEIKSYVLPPGVTA